MAWLARGVQLLIPLVVLYSIGYYIPGFSALSIPWILLLGVLIFIGEWLLQRTIGRRTSGFSRILINLLAALIIIFTLTLGIEGGNVPLGGALLAATIISALTELVYLEKIK